MNQEKILKIIKGLNTFSLDDIVMMTGIDMSKVKDILDSLISQNIIIQTNQGVYRYKGFLSKM